jgi:hypothetical protein
MTIFTSWSAFALMAVRRAAALWVLVTALFVSLAGAVPITYTGYTIASGQLGSWSFKNAQVYINYTGDTNDVQIDFVLGVYVAYNGPYALQQLCTGPVIHQGVASVTIVSGGRAVHATFAPNQISVSTDLGGVDLNGFVGYPRGIGFGVCAPTGFEPAYPLGIQDGTADQDNFEQIHQFSAELLNLNPYLTGPADFSGRAWLCYGFAANPGGSPTCNAPPALKTDKGDFHLFQGFRQQFVSQGVTYLNDALTTGLFWANLGADTSWQSIWSPSFGSDDYEQPITYTGAVLTDVSLGGQFFSGAQVYLSATADAAQVQTTNSANGPLYINNSGRAHIRIVSGGQTVTANLARGQIYTYFDVPNSSVGFGSRINGVDYRGYPLTLTEYDCNSITDNTSVGAVADIIRSNGADSIFYTADVQRLVTNLKTKTFLSGPASSCADFTPATSVCAFSLAVPQLQTDQGPLFLYEPYTDIDQNCGTGQTTVNFGIFRAQRTDD